MLCAAAIIFSYAETLIPVSLVPIPGFKIGLANTVILICVYSCSFTQTLSVNLAKTAVVALLFSGMSGALFSLVGGTLAVCAMYIIKKSKHFSIYSAGVLGAVAHNIGQMIVASILLKTVTVFAYLPWLMLCSLICGLLISLISSFMLKIMQKSSKFVPKC